jgi:DNA phosphorothioation-associated putative methyltransferase
MASPAPTITPIRPWFPWGISHMHVDERGKTAMSRTALSRPVALALNDGLLVPDATVFDYGCGRGGDLHRLKVLGYSAAGWDPAHYSHGEQQSADVVNLGYVVNVIENPVERAETLRQAWALTKDILVVAARTDFEATRSAGLSCGDGILTGRGTFQKFFSQEELRAWIESVLGVRSVAASPGIFYVFRNEVRAQAFLAARVRHRSAVARRPKVSEVLYEANRAILDPLISFIESRGRAPEFDEVPEAAAVRDRFGSIKAALAVVRRVTGNEAWKAARAAASEDLLVYMALAAFGGRPRFMRLPDDIQHDVKAFFGSYKEACGAADALLYRAGQPAEINRACQQSTLGKLTRGALYVHISALDRLSPLLRVYEGCGRALTGTVDGTTVVKLNFIEPKVSYLVYPEFDRDPHPVLAMSVRAHLQQLHVKVRDFRTWANPPILHRKEAFVACDYPARNKFARLTLQEENAGLFEDPSVIGTRDRWTDLVARKGLSFRGHRVIRVPASTS